MTLRNEFIRFNKQDQSCIFILRKLRIKNEY